MHFSGMRPARKALKRCFTTSDFLCVHALPAGARLRHALPPLMRALLYMYKAVTMPLGRRILDLLSRYCRHIGIAHAAVL